MSEVHPTFEGGRYQEKLHSVLAKTAFLLTNTQAIEPEGVASGLYTKRIDRPEKSHREILLAMGIDGVTAYDPSLQEPAYPTYDYYITARANAEFGSGLYPRVQSGAIISTANGETTGYIGRTDLTTATLQEYQKLPKLAVSPPSEIEVVDDEYAIEQLAQVSIEEATDYLGITELVLDVMIDEYTFRRIL